MNKKPKRRSPDDSELLIKILALSDSLWEPYRFHPDSEDGTYAAIEIHKRRDEFESRGVRIVPRGSESERKAHERHLVRLRDMGLIRLHKPAVSNIGVSLQVRGEEIAKSLCSSFLVHESFGLIASLLYWETLGYRSGWILESDIYDGIHPSRLTDRFLPLLSRQWVESLSDTIGCVGYRVTEAGREAWEAGAPKKTPRLPRYLPRLGDLYDVIFRAGLADRENWRHANSNYIFIPLAAGSWPHRPSEKT